MILDVFFMGHAIFHLEKSPILLAEIFYKIIELFDTKEKYLTKATFVKTAFQFSLIIVLGMLSISCDY